LAKSKILLWIVVLFLFSIDLRSDEIIQLIEGKYFLFKDLTKVFPQLKVQLTTPGLKGKIVGEGDRRIDFKLSSSFYHFKGNVKKMTNPIILSDGKLYFPTEFIDPILSNLIEYDTSFFINDNNLFLNIPGSLDTKKENLDLDMVVIDPGHGGSQVGATSVYNDLEKDYNLEVSLLLYRTMRKKFPKLRIEITRSNDEFIDYKERADLFNKLLGKSDRVVVLSLHCNGFTNSNANGFEILVLNQSKFMEQKKRKTFISLKLVDMKVDKEITNIYAQMLTDDIQRKSIILANHMNNSLSTYIGKRITNRGIVFRSNLNILNNVVTPAIFIEMGFITNPEDARLLSNHNFRIKIVNGIIEGLKNYSKGENF
jgi:N-acetylmuramoyl-L-alanine amidase